MGWACLIWKSLRWCAPYENENEDKCGNDRFRIIYMDFVNEVHTTILL